MQERMIFVIDMVNGFVKEGALADPSILKIVPAIKQIINDKKGEIVEVKECHNENSLEFKNFPPHCIKGTYEAETCDELKNELENCVKFYKNSTSALFGKDVINYILNNPVNEIIITGCCTDICIMNFAIPLKNLFNELGIDTEIIIYKDAVDTYNAPNHKREYFNEIAFLLMEQCGILVKNYEKEEIKENGFRKVKENNYGK